MGYLGPPGTFSEEALLASAERGAIIPVGLPSIYEVVVSLGRGELEWALVPVENSLEGSVSATLDVLAEHCGEVEIVGEVVLAVRHSLIAAGAIELEEIEAVVSHPHVPGQCRRFLRSELPQARVLSASSTAEAVRLAVSGGTPTMAALGTLLAAEIYGGTVLRKDVQDRDDNETRFLWLGKRGSPGAPPLARAPGSHGQRTSLVFWGAGAERPGWLLRCLEVFAERELNLSRIESRPRRERIGHYMFFVDLEGGMSEGPVAEAVARLRQICEEVLVLGSYPRAGGLSAGM